MLKTCPNSVDVQDIQFKLHCRLKVFDNKELQNFSNPHSLISCASRFGLLFIGSNSPNLQAVLLKSVEAYTSKDKDINNYPRRTINLPSAAKHVCVNCDSTILAVVVQKDKCPIVIFYDILSFYKQNIVIIKEVRLSATPEVTVTEVAWNPAVSPIFTACKSDGTLGVYEIKGSSVDINELPPAAQTSSFCWSPKGKQIAVGSKNGKITQYKPDLKAVKVVNEPPLQRPHSLISLQWVSNYQFVGIYQSEEAGDQAKLVVVDAPKTGETSYTNYDDVCYSGSTRIPQFYMLLQQHWNILMVASSNSTEVGVLGTSSPDCWTQWIIADFARAELPLSADKQETLPVGLALDISPTKPLPWGEGTIPPCPYLLMLSHQGVLCFFNFVNLRQGAPIICCPPDVVADTSGLTLFVNEAPKAVEGIGGLQPVQPQPLSSFSFASAQSTAAPALLTPKPAFATAKPPAAILSQPQATPAVAKCKPTETQSLFGGQTTPVKPQQPVASKPATAAPLFGGKTSVNPAAAGGPFGAKPESTNATGDNRYSSILSALNAPVVAPPPANQGKAVVAAAAASEVDAKAVIDEKVKGETDAMLAKMVKDECLALESEVKALLHQGRRLKIDVGSDEEKSGMLGEVEVLREFIKEIVDISIGENAEIYSLKQNLILSWAWNEEARSRYNISKDETMKLLLKSQPLDSATEKRRSDIQKLFYYLESQLLQTNKALDEQWDRFQDYAKKTHKVQMPTMEAIFQSMVKQNAILQKQRYLLKDIASRIKHKKTASKGPPLILTAGKASKLEDDLKSLQLEPEDPHQVVYEAIVNKTKNLTATKQSKLRNLLRSRNIMHVVKPQLHSSLLQSPATRMKQISILGAQMSPVQKLPIARNLDFVQSTPIRDVKADMKPTLAPPNTPAQTEAPKMFTFKNLEQKVPVSLVNPNFIPATTLTFSQTSRSNHPSAFASTMPASKMAMSKSSDKPVTSAFPTAAFSFGNTNSSKVATYAAVAVSTPKSQPVVSIKSSTSQLSKGITVAPLTSKKSEPSLISISTCASSTKSLFSFGTTSSETFKTTAASSSSLFGSLSQTTVPLFGNSSTISFGAKSNSTTVQSNTSITSSNTSAPSVGSTKTTPNLGISVSIPLAANKAVPAPTLLSFSTSTASSVTQPTVSKPSTTGTGVSTLKAATTKMPSAFTFSTSSVPELVTPGTNVSNPLFGSAVPTVAPALSTTPPTSFRVVTTTSSPIVASASTPPATADSTTPSTGSTTASSTVTSSVSVPPAIAINTATTGNSLFGSSPATASITTPLFSSTIFGSATTTAAGGDLSGSSTPSSSVSSSTPAVAVSTTVAQPSLFGSSRAANSDSGAVTSSSTQAPVFGGSTHGSLFGTSSGATTSQTSIFGGAPQTGSTLGGGGATTRASIFGSASAQSPVFAAATPTTTTQASIFGSAATSKSSLFGTPTTTVASSTSFVRTPAAVSVSPFGSTPATTSTTFFGNTPAVTSTSLFGSTPAVTSTSIFGSSPTATPAVTSASPFGSTPTSTSASIFGSTPAATFGSNPAAAFGSIPASAFGAAPAVTSASLFSSTPVIASTAPFGQSGSLFSAPATTTSAFGGFGGTNVFGSTTATTTGGFGQPAFGASTTSASVFGAAAAPASGSVFGAPAVSSSSFSFDTANSATGASSFGFGGLNVGNTGTSTSGSIFGQAAANPFGGSGSSIFGTPTSSTASLFGGSTTGTFGGTGQSGFGSSGSAFGQQPVFGQSAFGTGTSSFGGPQPGAFSGTGGGAAVGQSGFGSPSSFQKPSGFGATPAFGGSPQTAFGTGPSFGGAPTFGSPSPSKVFGSSTPAAAFGSPSASSSGFGNLANQNTLGFGNLAQQASNAPTTTAFSGNTSFSNWR